MKKSSVSSPRVIPPDEIYTNIVFDRLLVKFNYKLSGLEYAVTRNKVKELLNNIKDKDLLELLLLLTVDQYKENFKPTSSLYINTLYSIKNRIAVPEKAYKYSLAAYKEPPASLKQKTIDYWLGYWMDTGDEKKAIAMLEKIDLTTTKELDIETLEEVEL